MTTGATGQLGLALPVQGELSGTWGNTVNNGITEYTNIAIAATLTLTNDGAVTLANTTGDAAATNIVSSLTGAGTVTAQFAIVKVTGTLTTPKIITAPSYSKTYLVVNAATGSTVSFIRSGQTPAVSIAVGESAYVYYNGTDYVKVAGTAAVTSFTAGTTGFTPSTATTGAVTLAGTLATTNGGTGLTSFTANGVVYASSTSALATGSVLTFDGTTITTPRLALSGTTLPSAGTATLFSRSSDNNTYLQTGSGNNINFLDGSQNTMLTLAPTNLIFQISNAEKMRLNSSGYLGIGNTSPQTNLSIGSSAGSGSNGLGIYLARGATTNFLEAYDGTKTFIAGTDSSNSYVKVGSLSNHNLNIVSYNGAGGTLTLDTSGNLGLGVTPSAWDSTFKALESGSGSLNGGSFFVQNNGDYTTSIATNLYYNAGWKYKNTASAARYEVYQNKHQWFTAPSGTAGNAITFTQAMTLDASGNLGVGATTGFNALSGTETTIYVKNAGVNVASLYLDAVRKWAVLSGTAGQLAFYDITGSTERMRIDSSGNVGIGLTSPNFKLSVYGPVASQWLSANATEPAFVMGDTANATAGIWFQNSFSSTNATQMIFKTRTAAGSVNEAARIDSSGTLLLKGTSTGNQLQFWMSGSEQARLGINASNGLDFAVGSTSPRMTIDSSGNLLVGGTSVINGAKLLVTGNTNGDINQSIINTNTGANAHARLDIGNAGYNSSELTIYAYSASASSNTFGISQANLKSIIDNSLTAVSNGLLIGTGGANPLYFGTNSTEAMRIDSSGNLLVGTTTANGKLFSSTSSASQPALRGASTSATYADNIVAIDADRNTTNNTFYAITYYNNGAAAAKFRVADSGNVTNTNNSYGAVSDIKLKENIVDATPKLVDLLKVQVRNYNLKTDPSHKQLGVVAQELEQVFPSMIDESPDKDKDGNDLGTTTKSVKYSVFVPMLVKAIQELSAKVTALEAKLGG